MIVTKHYNETLSLTIHSDAMASCGEDYAGLIYTQRKSDEGIRKIRESAGFYADTLREASDMNSKNRELQNRADMHCAIAFAEQTNPKSSRIRARKRVAEI